MDFLKRNFKRIATDIAGYFLLIAAVLTGWLPGPGGIPLFIAGLGLLSINNKWAARIRDYLLEHGGKLVKVLFPAKPWVQWLYDGCAILLFVICIILEVRHAALWEISLGIALFGLAVFIALMNRERLQNLREKRKR